MAVEAHMKGYKHTELGIADGALMSKVRLTTIQFRGQNVLVRHFTGDEASDPFIMVPGTVAGGFKIEGDSLPVTSVVPIQDEAHRQELRAFLQHMEGVPTVHFWN